MRRFGRNVEPPCFCKGCFVLTFHSGVILEKVAEYFQYWHSNKDKKDVPDMHIPPELCLEILMAADFLRIDCKSRVLSRLETQPPAFKPPTLLYCGLSHLLLFLKGPQR